VLENLKSQKEEKVEKQGISTFQKSVFFESPEDRRPGALRRETRKRTAVIWEVVTWTKIWPRGIIFVSAISTFRYFRDWEIEESKTLDISPQEVPKPGITCGKRSRLCLKAV